MPSPSELDDESVDALLGNKGYQCDGQLRNAVLMQTAGVLRRRRYARRAVLVAALVICYVAGTATTQLWRLSDPDAIGQVAQQRLPQKEQQRDAISRPEPDRVLATLPNTAQKPPRSPKELRQAGFEDIRRVSDRYLHDKGNVRLALHYYSRALDAASSEQRAISVEEDSWLLMALKASRMEETKDDNKT